MNMERPNRQTNKEDKKQPPFQRAFQEVGEPFDPLFESAVKEGILAALESVHKRFEDTEDPEIEGAKGPNDNLEFHNTDHTGDVMRRIRLLLEAVGANERRIKLGELMAAYHDTIQGYEAETKPDGSVMRKRHLGKNETGSAEELVAYMREHPTAFKKEEIDAVDPGIQNTVPEFDPILKAVVQPNFLKSTESELGSELDSNSLELVKRALALADLGTAGMDGPDKFLPEGNVIFREENLDVPTLLHDPEKRAFLKERMLTWSQIQVNFATTRKALFGREMKGLPKSMVNAVRKVFGEFDNSIEAALEQLKRREKMTFEELVHDFGYTPPKYTIQ